MSKQTKKKTICAICENELTLSTEIIVNGCPYCGSFKFKTFREPTGNERKEQELELIIDKEIKNTDIQEGLEAIRLTKDGVFEVDVDKLIAESNDDDPIIARNKDGSYYIRIEPKKDEENEK
ncbi:MAG: Zn-ribbon containing protein [Candidatus Thorarchaeota archaeon]